MSAAAPAQQAQLPTITSSDRFGFLLVVSSIVHTFIILTVGFAITVYKDQELPPTLEVVLVQKKSEESPDDAKRLANEDNVGGGTVDENTVRSTPFKAPFEGNQANIAYQTGSPAMQEPLPNTLQILTTDLARKDAYSEDVEQQKKLREKNFSNIDQISMQIEAFEDVIDRKMKQYAERPKRVYIHTRTKKHWAAAYMKHYEAKVERTGNMNYPRRVKGEVIMNVGIFRNGRVESINIVSIISDGVTRRSVLKDAAKRIVRLAAPFQAFSPDMGDADILHMTRTYIFSGKKFSTKATR